MVQEQVAGPLVGEAERLVGSVQGERSEFSSCFVLSWGARGLVSCARCRCVSPSISQNTYCIDREAGPSCQGAWLPAATVLLSVVQALCQQGGHAKNAYPARLLPAGYARGFTTGEVLHTTRLRLISRAVHERRTFPHRRFRFSRRLFRTQQQSAHILTRRSNGRQRVRRPQTPPLAACACSRSSRNWRNSSVPQHATAGPAAHSAPGGGHQAPDCQPGRVGVTSAGACSNVSSPSTRHHMRVLPEAPGE